MAKTRPKRRPAGPVEVQMATKTAALPRGADPAAWVAAAGGRGELTVRLVGWAESRQLNARFRGKDEPTNVLAFTGSAEILGDLVICLPLVHREAREQGKTPLEHLAHLVVHGTLHLLGHDHHKAAAARKMEARETMILRRLGFPDPHEPA